MTRLAIISTAALFVTASGALAQAVVPDPTLTPGSVRTTNLGEICFEGTGQHRHRHDDMAIIEIVRPRARSRGLSSRSITWCRSNLAAATTSPTYGRSRASQSNRNGTRSARTSSKTPSTPWSATAHSISRSRRKPSSTIGPRLGGSTSRVRREHEILEFAFANSSISAISARQRGSTASSSLSASHASNKPIGARNP